MTMYNFEGSSSMEEVLRDTVGRTLSAGGGAITVTSGTDSSTGTNLGWVERGPVDMQTRFGAWNSGSPAVRKAMYWYDPNKKENSNVSKQYLIKEVLSTSSLESEYQVRVGRGGDWASNQVVATLPSRDEALKWIKKSMALDAEDKGEVINPSSFFAQDDEAGA